MKRMFLIAVLVAAVGGSVQAGPFGLFGRGRCRPAATSCGSCAPCGQSFTPVRTAAGAVVQPVRQVAGELFHSTGNVLTGMGNAVLPAGGCANGTCRPAVIVR